MFRIKLSKFKQVIAIAIIPRIFVRDSKLVRNKLSNCTLDVFSRARKSTGSGSKDDENEKQRQIIEKCFGETSQDSKDLKDDSSEMEKEQRTIMPSDFVRLSGAEKCDAVKSSDNEPSHGTSGMRAEASVRATTANIAEETLDQKVERIDETPHVEASPQKIEGFNSTPKVLGHDIELFAEEKIQQIDLDDLAKRCVGAPIGNIDELLIKEMKNMANNDVKTQSDMNLIKSHGVEKYYSGIFHHFSQRNKAPKVEDTPREPLHLFYENKSIGDKEIKSERITPLHIDSVHLFAFDEESKDYKETGLFRDSFVNLSSHIEERLEDQVRVLDLPSIITPYESPAMPYYEYVNKEQVILDEFDESETMIVPEASTDSRFIADIPRAEEVFLKKKNTNEPSLVIEKHKTDPVASEPTFSYTAVPILGSNLKESNIASEFANLSREQLLKLLHLYKKSHVNETTKSHVCLTSTDIPPGGDQISPAPNSAISGTFVQEVRSKDGSHSIEIPENTAISANQNPGEYYNMSLLNEELASNLSEQLQTLTAENHLIHAFCTQLQQTEDGFSKETEDSIKILEYPVLLRDPFSYILLQPETNENIVIKGLTDKITATTIENLTVSTKTDATNADDNVPLSQILKRIRDKNRLEFCRNLLLQSAKPETKENFTCITPLDRSKPKTTLHPGPCKPPPPPPPPKEKCPNPCPPPCPPKKDPCAKLIPFFLNTMIRFDMSFDIQAPMKQYNGIYTYKSMVTDDIIERLRKLGKILHLLNFLVVRNTNYAKDTTCAKDYEPWIPIPSWPEPKVEKKRPFVCPKEGCKPVPVPRPNAPKQRPCLGVPKKTFSFSQLCSLPVNKPDIIFINL